MGRKKRVRGNRSSETDQIRRALEKTRKDEIRIGNRRHGEPYLDCDEVCEIAMKHLRHEGITGRIVVGKVQNQSHAWIETDKYVVDPTSDQFGRPNISVK